MSTTLQDTSAQIQVTLQIAALCLLTFNGFKQASDIANSEALHQISQQVHR
jgi:hypothetical protein